MGKGKLLRKGLTMLLVVVMIIGILPGVGSLEVSAEESGASEATITPSKPKGEGTKASPYQIGTAAELYWFADKVNNENATYKNANAVLTADITVNTGVLNEDGELNDTGEFIKWTPIGADDCLFQGTFNGQNHSISGLYFNDDSAFDVGLFGYLYYGNISNVGVKDSYFNGANSVGGLCGTLHNGSTITNCYNAGRVEGIGWVGGVCGANRGTITKCYSTGRISGTKLVGGLCGVSYGTITDCYSIGIVNETLLAGGLCGALMRDSTITNCYYDDENGYKGEAFGQKFESNVENVSSKTTQEMHKSTFCTLIGYASYQNGICILCDNYQPADYTEYKYDIDGDKSKDEVYEIGNAGQLYWFSELVNGTLPSVEKNTSANAVLTQNITVNTGVLNEEGNLNDTSKFLEWIPIGTDICEYQGTFDGQNHTISGLYFEHSVKDNIGLFGCLRADGRVINVGVEDSYFSGNDKVGSICGVNKGTVENCYNTGNVSGYVYVGGVCGQNNNAGVVQNCYNTGNVNGMRNYVGGVCGQNNNVIQNCYNTGDVNGSLSTVGGVCGNNNTNATIKNCYYNVKDNGIGVNDGTETNVEGKTTEQFQSGEVAYLLQGDIEQQTELVWGQTLTGGNRQASPVLGGDRVYKVNRYLGCKDALGNPTDAYSNLDEAIFEPHKDDGNGDQNKAYDNKCDFCDELCHTFNDDGICEEDGYHQGVITNANYSATVAY